MEQRLEVERLQEGHRAGEHPSRSEDPGHLLHDPVGVADVLEHCQGQHPVEAVIGERQHVCIDEEVRSLARIVDTDEVDPERSDDGTHEVVDATAHVE